MHRNRRLYSITWSARASSLSGACRVKRWSHLELGRAADGLRRKPEIAQERSTHPLAVAEAALVGDGLHRVAPLLQHQTGGLDPQALHRLGRRLAGLLAEGAAELARAEPGRLGELVQRQGGFEVGVGQGGLDAVRLGL